MTRLSLPLLLLSIVISARAEVVSKWSFEDNLLDSAVGGVASDNLGGTALNGPLSTNYVPGVVGQAVVIGEGAGEATVLSAPDSDDLDLAPEFTVEAYVYRSVEHGNDWERFATKWFDGSNQWHWAFRGPPNRSQDLFLNGSQQINQSAVNADVPLNEWVHVAMTGDPANGLRLWQDGVVVGSANYLIPQNGTDRFRLGNATAGAGTFQFSGYVDEFQIHDVSQDATYMAERTALITGGPAITNFTASPSSVADGESSTLSWTTSNADTLTLDGGSFVNSDVTGQLMAIATNLSTDTTFTLTASNAQGSTTAQVTVGVGVSDAELRLNEFLAINAGGLDDEDGDASDWIEIFNPGAAPAPITGWFLTDDPLDLTKWRFPTASLPALGYLVVFASNKDRTTGTELHTNFRLSGDGEYLALVKPDGVTIATEFAPSYPPQQANVSYGIHGDPATARALFPPTPNAPNNTPAGPTIRNLTRNPVPIPEDRDDLVVTAEILPSPSPVTSATLHYRVLFGAELTLPMTDTGDGIYQATIPASASRAREMVRWRVTAQSQDGNSSKAPLFLDPLNSPEYHGTVIRDPRLRTSLPVMERFIANPSGTESRSGTRGAFFFEGEFYDNIFTRIRGGTSQNWPKKSYKIEFNDGHHFRFREGVPRVDEINLNTTYTDKSYVRAILSYEHQRDAGMPSPEAFAVQLRQNGEFWNVSIFMEQPDRDYLRRWNLDPDGALYKGAFSPTNYEPSTPLSRWEKKTRHHEDKSDLDAFIDGLALTRTRLELFLFDHVDLPRQINYMATTCITQNIDGSDKNHYLYRDTEGSGEWTMLPWDLDLSFGPNALNTDNMVFSNPAASHPYIGARPHILHGGKYNHLLEVIVGNSRTKAMLNRRIRTLIDEHLASGYFHDRIDQLVRQINLDARQDRTKWGGSTHFPGATYSLLEANDRIKSLYLDPRVSYLTVTQGEGGGGAGIPASQPTDPTVTFGSIVYNPLTGNQDQEYIEIQNPNAYDLDVSGWTLEGGVIHTMRGGTVIPATNSLYLSPNVAAFRDRATSPRGRERLFIQGNYQGHLSNFGEDLILKDKAGTIIAQTTTPATPSDPQRYLVIGEIMYHPAGDPDAEFIELQNISDSVTLDLDGVRFTNGVIFDFTDSAITNLGPGQRVLVVRNRAAFEAVHGVGLPIAGEFADGSLLNNDGDRLKLEDSSNSTIVDFRYNDALPWPTAPDGLGPSLILIAPASNPDPSLAKNWRSSLALDGNPNTSDAIPFGGTAGTDSDRNGLDDLLDYALGNAPGQYGGLPIFSSENGGLTFTYSEKLGADDVRITPEWSLDLVNWQALGDSFDLISLTPDAGRRTFTYASDPAHLPASDQLFIRLVATSTEG